MTSTAIATCFVASHIGNYVRLLYFQAMLRSWADQSVPCNMVLILSADNESLLDKAQNVVKMYPQITLILHKGSQFQKLGWAVYKGQLDLKLDDWIMFGDDDDLWHPDRVKIFTNCARQALPCADQIRVSVASEIKQSCVATGGDTLSKAERVLLSAVVSNNTEQYHRLDGYHYNLWSFAVKYKVLVEFCMKANTNLLQHKYADYAFSTFLMNTPFMHRVYNLFPHEYDLVGLEPSNWMYFFRLNRDCKQLCVEKSSSLIFEQTSMFNAVLKGIRVKFMEQTNDLDKLILLNQAVDEVHNMIPFVYEKIELQFMRNMTTELSFDPIFDMYFAQTPSITPDLKDSIMEVLKLMRNQFELTFLGAHSYLLLLRPPRYEKVDLNEEIEVKSGAKFKISELFEACNINMFV